MSNTVDNKALVLDLVEWIAESPRAYRLVMEAWRTSCPRLTIWEDTVDAGFIRMQPGENSEQFVFVIPYKAWRFYRRTIVIKRCHCMVNRKGVSINTLDY